ncbi:hypothetical protein BDZ97DRAFT_569061 [Flammula alnicola]|nr:hypothetical protein BDZ97DRAFT_569061 [Flammula alnicola]
MREVAAALSGMKLSKAYAYLGDVKDHKRVIPFRRFAGGVGRASQAKEFKATQGRWPEKSVKFITRLLKTLNPMPMRKALMWKIFSSETSSFNKLLKPAAAHIVHMVVSTPTRVTLVTLRSSSAQARLRSRRPPMFQCPHFLSQVSTAAR